MKLADSIAFSPRKGVHAGKLLSGTKITWRRKNMSITIAITRVAARDGPCHICSPNICTDITESLV